MMSSEGSWFEKKGVLPQIRRLLAERSNEGYVVGGYVRDLLVKRGTPDLDLVITDDAVGVAREAADKLGGAFVLLDEERHTARVVLREQGHRYFIDFATMRGETLHSDLEGRDFTVNAMAIDVQDGGPEWEIIDPFDGRQDLESRVLRAVSQSVFRDDAVRILRAVRFKAELALEVEETTEGLIARDASLIRGVSAERARDELSKILTAGDSERHLRYLDYLGVLRHLLPELEDLRGVEQPLPHHEDAFQHSLSSVGAMDWVKQAVEDAALAQELPITEGWGSAEEVHESFRAAVGPFAQQVAKYLSEHLVAERDRPVVLQLAALLHDVGKANTTKVDEKGRIRFFGHAEESATVAAGMLRRLHFGNREVRLVRVAVRLHMRPLQLAKLPKISDRAIYRFFRDARGAGVDVLLIALADNLALVHAVENLDQWERICETVGLLLGTYYERYDRVIDPEPLLDGSDLMERFAMEPGPAVGKLLRQLHEAQAAGQVSTREQAFQLVESLLSEPSG
jgi:tRNA nucleotidyltransferase/poly(A) polymerase